VDQSILTLESDKATMEIPCPAAGTVQSVAVKVGDKLNQGDLLLTARLGTADPPADRRRQLRRRDSRRPGTGRRRPSPTPPRLPGEAERRKAPVLPRPADMQAIAAAARRTPAPPCAASPANSASTWPRSRAAGARAASSRTTSRPTSNRCSARRTGAAAATGLPFQLPARRRWTSPSSARSRPSRCRASKRISGAHLHRCWLSVPHVTQFDEADITELEAFRKGAEAAAEQAGVKLTFMPFLLKAVAGALAQMPNLKASLARTART
jgi:pyruvate dehydrogenase E2 component (dihydrolipoamide acetyltransferase)